MTVKTTLSFTDRHHDFLRSKVEEGVFATPSAAVAAAVEQLIEDEKQRQNALDAISSTISTRMQTPKTDFVDGKDFFDSALQKARPDNAV